MLSKTIIFSTVVIISVGCATPPPPVIQTVIQRVEVPIPIPCKAETPAKPDFNFDKLKEEDSIFDKVKSLLADRKLSEGYQRELSAALESCK